MSLHERMGAQFGLTGKEVEKLRRDSRYSVCVLKPETPLITHKEVWKPSDETACIDEDEWIVSDEKMFTHEVHQCIQNRVDLAVHPVPEGVEADPRAILHQSYDGGHWSRVCHV